MPTTPRVRAIGDASADPLGIWQRDPLTNCRNPPVNESPVLTTIFDLLLDEGSER